MTKLKIKLIGQLVDDEKPTTLLVSEDFFLVKEKAEEYISVFPGIFITAEWGYFRIPISRSKAIVLSNLFSQLNTPMVKLTNQIKVLQTSKS